MNITLYRPREIVGCGAWGVMVSNGGNQPLTRESNNIARKHRLFINNKYNAFNITRFTISFCTSLCSLTNTLVLIYRSIHI